jgi:hypothetical protein
LKDGKVLIVGGMHRNQDFYRSAELYDPATGEFQSTGAMSLARVGHAAVLLRSGKVLVVGGWVGMDSTDYAELYDPATGKFTTLPKMIVERGRPTAALLGERRRPDYRGCGSRHSRRSRIRRNFSSGHLQL